MFGALQSAGYSRLRPANETGGPCLTWFQRIRAIVILFASKIWRGGPRFLLQLTASVLAILLLAGLFPQHIQHNYAKIISWTRPVPDEFANLRIVVFGSQDLSGSGISVDGSKSRKSWTEELCQLMDCSIYTSVVPSASVGPVLTSNAIYGSQLADIANAHKDENVEERPSADIEFLSEHYPNNFEIPDLDAQIARFLAMPAPVPAPKHTLWIFSFGTWDIWNLSAFPRKAGEAQIDIIVNHLFSRIEHLYIQSLNPQSPAFSDFWSNATSNDIDRLANPESAKKVDPRQLENFRILIPELFDITLTPIWDIRRDPPFPHTKGEQMRNAAHLTMYWNSKVTHELQKWTEKGQQRPEGVESEAIAQILPGKAGSPPVKYLPPGENLADAKVVYAPYPRRSGTQSPSIKTILSIMTEEGMQRAGLQDAKGRGGKPATASMRFPDVWTPCLPGGLNMDGMNFGTNEECSMPNDHLFYDRFTMNQKAIDNVAAEAAKKVREDLFKSR